MQYNYYFDIAALISGIFILTVYSIRRTLRTRSNKYLLVLLVCSIIGSAFDIISCFTISFPERYSMIYNYFACYGYLIFYNFTGILFLAYIDAKTKIPRIQKAMNAYMIGLSVFYVILITTSPITHLVSYYDENMVYRHGPMMYFLYFMAFFNLSFSWVIFIYKRRRFNRYQVISFITYGTVVFLGVLIQAVVPSLLVGQFGCTLVLFFIYTSFENPVYYTYKSTTCYNRQAFLEISKMKLRNNSKLSLIAFAINDYDNIKEILDFKNIDRLSCVIAEDLYTYFGTDSYCIADDKFLVMITDSNPEDVIRNGLKEIFSRTLALVDTSQKVNVSPVLIENIDSSLNSDMIEDGILYVLNKGIGNESGFSFDEIVKTRQRRKDIARILKEGIKNEDFDVFYQPILSVSKNRFESAEALVRLRSQELGYISPEEFIPIAEKEGLVGPIGDIVFEKVCRFIHNSRITSRFGVKYIEINFSPLQCIQDDVVRKYRDIMDKYDIVPFWINLEITETAEIETNNTLIKNMIRFHNMGVSFSLDDYGSGFASADYLFRIPADLVKIDKSILWQAMKDDNAGIVLIGTLRLLKNLGKKIVVEGVETEKMYELLADNGVDYLQGYLYSKPIPEQEYVRFLEEKNIQ